MKLICVIRSTTDWDKHYIPDTNSIYSTDLTIHEKFWNDNFNTKFNIVREKMRLISLENIKYIGFDKIYYNREDFKQDFNTINDSESIIYFIDDDDFVDINLKRYLLDNYSSKENGLVWLHARYIMSKQMMVYPDLWKFIYYKPSSPIQSNHTVLYTPIKNIQDNFLSTNIIDYPPIEHFAHHRYLHSKHIRYTKLGEIYSLWNSHLASITCIQEMMADNKLIEIYRKSILDLHDISSVDDLPKELRNNIYQSLNIIRDSITK